MRATSAAGSRTSMPDLGPLDVHRVAAQGHDGHLRAVAGAVGRLLEHQGHPLARRGPGERRPDPARPGPARRPARRARGRRRRARGGSRPGRSTGRVTTRALGVPVRSPGRHRTRPTRPSRGPGRAWPPPGRSRRRRPAATGRTAGRRASGALMTRPSLERLPAGRRRRLASVRTAASSRPSPRTDATPGSFSSPARSRAPATRARAGHVLGLHHRQGGPGRRHGQRLAAERAAVVAGHEGRRHLGPGPAGPDRHPVAERLGHGHDVGLDAQVLEAEPPPGPPQSGLDLVHHQQDVPVGAQLAQADQVVRRRAPPPRPRPGSARPGRPPPGSGRRRRPWRRGRRRARGRTLRAAAGTAAASRAGRWRPGWPGSARGRRPRC